MYFKNSLKPKLKNHKLKKKLFKLKITVHKVNKNKNSINSLFNKFVQQRMNKSYHFKLLHITLFLLDSYFFVKNIFS